jgi:hypothetical protein
VREGGEGVISKKFDPAAPLPGSRGEGSEGLTQILAGSLEEFFSPSHRNLMMGQTLDIFQVEPEFDLRFDRSLT